MGVAADGPQTCRRPGCRAQRINGGRAGRTVTGTYGRVRTGRAGSTATGAHTSARTEGGATSPARTRKTPALSRPSTQAHIHGPRDRRPLRSPLRPGLPLRPRRGRTPRPKMGRHRPQRAHRHAPRKAHPEPDQDRPHLRKTQERQRPLHKVLPKGHASPGAPPFAPEPGKASRGSLMAGSRPRLPDPHRHYQERHEPPRSQLQAPLDKGRATTHKGP